jgi:hypothetical protein
MKLHHIISLYLASFLLLPLTANAQTAGTMTLTFTTTSTGGFSPKHLVAVWLENSSAAFVKTKLKQSSADNLDHLALWTSKSGENVVDAITGATLATHGTLVVNWNGTAVDGNLVPDGDYTVWVEMAWAQSLTTGKTFQSYTFTKGPATQHLTPAGNANLLDIKLDWVPSVSSSREVPMDNGVSVYPNPAHGLLYISLGRQETGTSIRIISLTGAVVYTDYIEESSPIVKTLDISKFTPGVYFIRVENSAARTFKVFLN